MKKIFTLIFFALVFNLSAQLGDKNILDFTKANYLKLIGSMPEQNAKEFGFTSKDEIYHLTFTKVFAEYTLENSIPVKTNNYRVLALNQQGKPVGLFTVYGTENNLLVADFGANELAKTINTAATSFNANEHLSILRILNTQSDYLFNDATASPNKKYFKLFDNNFYSLTDIKKD